MNIFLTGATGFIGSVIAEKLQAAGHQVIGLARSEASAQLLQERGISSVRGGLEDISVLKDAVRSADGVIHTAFNAQDFVGSVETDKQAVRAMLAEMAGSEKPFILTSGTALLGDTGITVFDEQTPIPPFPPTADPGLKALSERLQIEQEVLDAKGVRGIVLRPPNVYGRSNGQSIVNVLKMAGQRLGAVPYATGSADHKWSFVHVDDLADLFVLAAEHAQGGELFHAAGEYGIRAKAIAEAVSRSLGQDSQTTELDIPDLGAALGMPSMAFYWASNSQSSAEKARQVLGWQPKHTRMLEEIAQNSISLSEH
ncbi:NAD-dependent epimerase/dehydratase family protein [Deinococcus marmoris]|nr:NAD-dependent epimerase/dehydratase family protein [Deinococcus marmoris]